ncbi:amylo-alpha-1,6-glucosidase [Rubrobacter aplysinae]|uniref:amylo-alpha-1,6-glucosidase n=1 Tax=Rubrobacter aplysinae TaxID=909625 RepID=UPI00064B8E8A|nr:trehalase family glycosidase [Rubrobacter aplysinae]
MQENGGRLVQQARIVLDFNWAGAYTKPSPRLYPHQWSWDSAFIALGYATYDTSRAWRELSSLFAGQWSNGLLPHIVFNPELNNYFPGSRVWRTELSPHSPGEIRTSGVVQPPVHAIAARRVYERLLREDSAGAEAFAEQIYPALAAWHGYLHRERDPDGTGLVYIRHPWESGMDNSPLWDGILQRIRLRPGQVPEYQRLDVGFVAEEDRPVDAEYDRYIHLVRHAADRGYDEAAIREDAPFLVWDVLFNTILCAADRDLAALARSVGEDPTSHEAAADATGRAMNARLWDEESGLYLDHDLAAGRDIEVYDALSSLLPLYGGIPDPGRAGRLVHNLESSGFFVGGDGYPAPSYARYGYGYSPVKYWRGPVWINTNWLLMHGLRRYGYEEHAETLRSTIVSLVQRSGFHEYFHPATGRGHGSDFFSWTAALLLDVLSMGDTDHAY